MSNEFVVESLKSVLADSYALYLKTQNYHWNVEGKEFKAIHELLESQYKDLADGIDDIAEMIRTFGEKAPGTWKDYKALTKIEDGDEYATSKNMLIALSQDQETIIQTLMKTIALAQNAGDEVVIGMLTDRIAIHRKNHWMLTSMLKE